MTHPSMASFDSDCNQIVFCQLHNGSGPLAKLCLASKRWKETNDIRSNPSCRKLCATRVSSY